MQTYGNVYWNEATDNRDKSIIPMQEETFKKIQATLENSGINYYAYVTGSGAAKLAVGDKDLDWLKELVGAAAADMTVEKSNVSHIPPEKNIIGNTSYRAIPRKHYLSMDSDLALKTAEYLNKANIPFSGIIYASGKATLTVDVADLERAKAQQQLIIAIRSEHQRTIAEKQTEIIGTIPYRNIRDKHFFFSRIKPELYMEIQPYLDKLGIGYSGIIRDNKVMFTVEEENASAFYAALDTAHNQAIITSELREAGLSEAQINAMEYIIRDAAQREMLSTIESFVNPHYTDEQFVTILGLLAAYIRAPEADRILDKNHVFSNLYDAKHEFDTQLALAEVYAKHSFSEEQKAAISEVFRKGVDGGLIDPIDETYTPEDIREYAEIILNADMNRLNEFFADHALAQTPFEKDKAYRFTDVYFTDDMHFILPGEYTVDEVMATAEFADITRKLTETMDYEVFYQDLSKMENVLSIEQGGTIDYFQTDTSLYELLHKGLDSAKPYFSLSENARKLSVPDCANLEQSNRCGFSVKFDYDSEMIEFYLMNGIGEADRTTDNTLIQSFTMSEVRSMLAEIESKSLDGTDKDKLLIDMLTGAADIDVNKTVSFSVDVLQFGTGEVSEPNDEQFAYIRNHTTEIYDDASVISAKRNTFPLYHSGEEMAKAIFSYGERIHEAEEQSSEGYMSGTYLDIEAADDYASSIVGICFFHNNDVVPFENAVKRINALGGFDPANMFVVVNLVEENGTHYQRMISQQDFYALAKQTMENKLLLHSAQRSKERRDSALAEIHEKVGAYLTDKAKMSAVVNLSVAGDELETIAERIIDNNENAAKVAKEYLNGFSFTFTVPDSELSDNAKRVQELNRIDVISGEDSAEFRFADMSVSYTWDEIGGFYRAAAEADRELERQAQAAHEQDLLDNAELYAAMDERRTVYLKLPVPAEQNNDYSVTNARKNHFDNFRLEFIEKMGWCVIADTDKEKDVVVENFTMVGKELVRHNLESQGYEITGYAEREKAEPTVEAIKEKSPKLRTVSDPTNGLSIVRDVFHAIRDLNDGLAPDGVADGGYDWEQYYNAFRGLFEANSNNEDIGMLLFDSEAEKILRCAMTEDIDIIDQEEFDNALIILNEVMTSYHDVIINPHMIARSYTEKQAQLEADLLAVVGKDNAELVPKLLDAFHQSRQVGWNTENNQVKISRIKKALYDVLGNKEQTENAYNAFWDSTSPYMSVAKANESPIHFGNLGNGIIAYDVSRTDPETNDYPTVAHISEEGIISYRTDKITDGDKMRIEQQARVQREHFTEYWSKLPDEKKMQEIYDRCNITQFVQISGEPLDMAGKIAKYEQSVVFKTEEFPQPEPKSEEIAEEAEQTQETEAPAEEAAEDTPFLTEETAKELVEDTPFLSDDTIRDNGLTDFSDEPIAYGEQLTLFDTGDEPVQTKRTRSRETRDDKIPTAIAKPDFPIEQIMIDDVLRSGSVEPHSLERIVAEYQKGKSTSEIAAFLQKEYGDEAIGVFSGDKQIAAVFDESGITIGAGITAYNEKSSVHLTWEQAAERIGELLENGEYAVQEALDAAHDMEIKDTAELLWYIHQDLSEGVEYFIPEEVFDNGGFPDNTALIAEHLQDRETLQRYIDGMRDFAARYADDPEIMRWHFHKPLDVLHRMEDLLLDRRTFTAKHGLAYTPKQFISEDEKQQFLLNRGSSVADYKLRISEFFSQSHTQKDKIDFLRNEYGFGGCSSGGRSEWHDSNGIKLQRSVPGQKEDSYTIMKWSEVVRQTERLVAEGRFPVAEAEQTKTPAKDMATDIPEVVPEKTEPVESPVIPQTEKVTAPVEDTPFLTEAPTAEITDSDEPVKLREIVIDLTPRYEQHRTPKQKTPAPKQADTLFHITDEALGEGGAKSKFAANILAIQTLKQIEAEKRPATQEEKEILSRYVGWGGLASAFDSGNASWYKEYTQLKGLLTDKEYRSARASTLDSFYTTPTVIQSIYQALEQFGFESGNILEPACGVGNFFGCMPQDMHRDSKLYATELDDITGRIAKLIYPEADIRISGFQDVPYQDGCFDVAVGNVPFGDLGFHDEEYDTAKLHDYFFAKALDKVKEGGIIAFVTSKGTLDKKDESVRQRLAEKADLIGAVRLPSSAFKANANTEVTTDIIFLQKRSSPPEHEPEWVHLGKTEDGLSVNSYYEQHPEMVLGQIVQGNKLYANSAEDTMCIPFEGADLRQQLSEAISTLSAQISDVRTAEVYSSEYSRLVTPPSELRNYSFFEHDDKIYFKRSQQTADEYRQSDKNQDRIKAFIALRDTTRELLTAQELDKPDDVIKVLQQRLNAQYDTFYKKYGLLHSQTNKRIFHEDVSYNLVLTLEKAWEKDKLLEKSDIFTKRTIKPPKAVDYVETAMEALALSSAEKACVDLSYMQSLTGMSQEDLLSELNGEVYLDPKSGTYQTASEYLSGDIHQKLTIAMEAAEKDSRFAENVTALQNALPEPLKAADIEIKIGAAWLDPKIYERFIYETFQTPDMIRSDKPHNFWHRAKDNLTVEYAESTGTFFIQNKSADRSVMTTQTFGSKHKNAYEIMEMLLNLKEPKVTKIITDDEGKEKRVVDMDATRVVQRKAEKIRAAWKDWIFKDPERREQLVKRYNELFNSIRPREYDGSHLTFPGMNTEITLHEHQKNAIAHALFGGNTLFAHSVGAGKTFEMIATAMEAKRLGLCTKSLFAVPNHLTEQIGADFMKLYPNANILVATKNDFKKENRQQLFAKIATGNFDAIIIGHSQLGMIPMSKERQITILQSQMDDIVKGIAELKASQGSRFQVKQMEHTLKTLKARFDALQKQHQDDVVTFEQMGIDRLFVDEAHEFKNRAKRCA